MLFRLMSKKQRSQQAQSTPSAPPDTQVLSVGQASCRQEKALSEDDPSGGGDSDESGAVFINHCNTARSI